MISFLKQPFPCTFGHKINFYVAALVGTFVAAFLLIFMPFGISESRDANTIIKTIGFGFVSFTVMLFIYFVLPKMFTNFFLEKNYTIGKELIVNIFMVLLIGLANSIYANNFIAHPETHSYLGMIWNTFLVAIFPISFLTLIQFNRLTKANILASQEIKLPVNQKQTKEFETAKLITSEPTTAEFKTTAKQYYFISGEQEKKQLNMENLLFLESDGNYAHLHQFADNQYSKSMHRTTLKLLEAENSFPNIIRCHRSYIVNLDQVKEVNGNAQGLKLTLHNYEDVVPVSRKYINDVKSYFNQSK